MELQHKIGELHQVILAFQSIAKGHGPQSVSLRSSIGFGGELPSTAIYTSPEIQALVEKHGTSGSGPLRLHLSLWDSTTKNSLGPGLTQWLVVSQDPGATPAEVQAHAAELREMAGTSLVAIARRLATGEEEEFRAVCDESETELTPVLTPPPGPMRAIP